MQQQGQGRTRYQVPIRGKVTMGWRERSNSRSEEETIKRIIGQKRRECLTGTGVVDEMEGLDRARDPLSGSPQAESYAEEEAIRRKRLGKASRRQPRRQPLRSGCQGSI